MSISRMHINYIHNLLFQKITGTISKDDNSLIERAIAEDDEVRQLWDDICRKLQSEKGRKFVNNLDKKEAWLKIEAQFRPKDDIRCNRIKNRRWLCAVALILIVFGVSFFYLVKNPTDKNLVFNEENDIRLKLADGRIIGLEENPGSLIDLGTIKINANEKRLIYNSSGIAKQEWSTLFVPVTKDYKIILSDGTEIWLNAASTLHFPFTFPDSLREVYLEGEAYFKVAKNTKQPFIVHSGNTDIRVLGTSFNVNSYNGDVSSSLIEGSILAKAENSKVILRPGFQTAFVKGKGFKTEAFDPEVVLSWINGTYYFHDQKLSDIAKVLQRWFGTTVVFLKAETARHKFTGTIEKSKPLRVYISNLQLSSDIQTELRNDTLFVK